MNNMQKVSSQKIDTQDAFKIMEAANKREAEKIVKKFECIISQSWFSVPKEVFDICTPQASLLYGHLLGFSNGIYRGSSQALAELMNCSTRNIARMLNELREKGCIKVVVISRSRRLIYPVYTCPFILDNEPIDTKSDKIDTKGFANGGFEEL